MNFYVLRRILFILLIIGAVILGLTVRAVNQSRIARFRVDVLDRFIHAYERAEGQRLERFSQLPNFHLISTTDSLSLKDTDLKQKIIDGYIYDWQVLKGGRYVISASPIGLFAPEVEYGLTEDGKLRMNRQKVDQSADSWDEVQAWPEIPRMEHIRSVNVPDYLKY